MFGQWLNRLRGKTLSPASPEWWQTDDYPLMASEQLMAICDAYWEQRPMDDGHVLSSGHCGAAVIEMRRRGPEVTGWALRHLSHEDYDARQTAADLLGSLAERDLLGSERPEAVAKLSALALRPRGEETKEVQANCAAVRALGAIGDRAALSVFRKLLLEDGWWSDDEIRWNAAEALERLASEHFMETDDPESAAAEWLRSH